MGVLDAIVFLLMIVVFVLGVILIDTGRSEKLGYLLTSAVLVGIGAYSLFIIIVGIGYFLGW